MARDLTALTRRPLMLLGLALVTLAACGDDTAVSENTAAPATTVVNATTVAPATTVVAGTTSAPATTAAPATTISAGSTVVNTWSGAPVDPTALPLGTDHVSLTTYGAGTLYVCDAGNPNGGGAFAVGPWIDEAAGTWDSTQKVKVQGEISWPMATYSEQVTADSRVIVANGLPVTTLTGTFPIAADDPAASYDRNPNSIGESPVSITLPAAPVAAAAPSCLPKGAIGVLKNGVAVYASIDATNRDAVAYETQDLCDGHPEQSSTYHYHDVPSCLREAATGSSTVVGFAFDGFPIVVERDAAGNLPSNVDLDDCHGRVSPIVLDGETVSMYHYSATLEFPYFMGCYRGTPVAA